MPPVLWVNGSTKFDSLYVLAMKRRHLPHLCWLALLITSALGKEPTPAGPSVIVVPTLETEVQNGKVVAWSAAMPSMWRELCDHLGVDKIALTPESKLANELNAWQLNPAVILPKDGYIILSGNGTKASVQAARDRLKQKFNESWPELDTLLDKPSDDSWFALCMLRQSLHFEPEFIPETEWAMLFKDSVGNEHAVKCFGTPASEADRFSPTVQVLRYKSPNTIISIKSSVPGEHLFLCTRMQNKDGSYITSMAKTVEDIQRAKTELNTRIAAGDKTAGHFGNGDLLEIPEVHFSGETQHLSDLKGTFQVPGKTQPQQFFFASHRVQFDMDAKGVKIEAKAGAGGGFGGPPPKPASKRAFVFDRPFFIIAWRDEAPAPYFAAYVDGNSSLIKSSAYRKQKKGIGIGFVSLPPSYKSRCSVAERLLVQEKSGETSEQESMISRGLEYLKASQNSDGSWGDAPSLETTSLALLSYMARCETSDSPFYGDQVMKAFLWMIEECKKEPPSKRSLKETAIVTQALGEMYTLARLGTRALPGMRDTFEAFVKNVIDRQLPNGTWADEDEEGYITTGHCIEALLTAKLTGLKIENFNKASYSMRKYFIETPQPQNLASDVAILRAAIAVNACMSRALFAEPAAPDVKSVVKNYRDLTTTANIQWNEAASLDHWLLVPLATRRYLDLIKTLTQGPVQDMLKAQDKDGSIKSGPTIMSSPTLTQKDIELRRTIIATLAAELPYRWRVTQDREGSLFDKP